MTGSAALAAIERGRIVAILRGDYRGAEADIVSVLEEAGVTAIEVTLNSPGAVGSIEAMASRFGDRLAVGAGTVLTTADVGRVAAAGASFVVSPNSDAEVIQATKRLQLASLPGCFTPTEIVVARNAGADAIKLFPARMVDPAIVSDLRGPFDDLRIIPTGGVTPERARKFLAAGAWAVGLGAALVDIDVLEPKGLDRLAARAAAFVAAVRADRDAAD